MITALIDGDWILYAAGFAGQKTKLVCPELYGSTEFANVTELKNAYGDKDVPFPTYSRIVLDPEEFFYHSAKKMIQTQLEKIAEKFDDEVRPRVMLDGDGNFRSRLATIRPYKGTRSVHAKPLMYNGIRQYLLDAWHAEVIYDQETDDELAIAQTLARENNEHTIIVGVDKDLLQVPGWHLNPNKGFRFISPAEGQARLYVQAAMGDATDNIAGAYKVGVKQACALIRMADPEETQWRALVGLYQASIDKHGDHYNGLSAREAALENMRLVYLRRTDGEPLWLPPHERDL